MPCPDKIILHPPANLIIDDQALAMSIGQPDGATTIGDLADKYCYSVRRMGHSYQRTDVVFDRYTQSSIKGGTRNRRTK